MSRRKIVAGNWKMNLNLQDAVKLANEVKQGLSNPACDVILFPSYLFISNVMQTVAGSGIKVGAQNCCHHENGAFTGSTSAQQLSETGVEYIILGHSERRIHHGESNHIVLEKLKLALKYNLKPVLCVGEPLDIRNENDQESFVLHQLEKSLFQLSVKEIEKVIIAYEPVWAIGTGLNASPKQAQQMHSFIRFEIASNFSKELAQQIPILYGGSCKPDNAKELFICADVDGGLIGGASLKAKDFLSIIQAL